jgi:hypothetical protein
VDVKSEGHRRKAQVGQTVCVAGSETFMFLFSLPRQGQLCKCVAGRVRQSRK